MAYPPPESIHCQQPYRRRNAQVVSKREEEAGGAGIALAAGPAAQLVVDSAGFVAFRADHMQATSLTDLLFILFHHSIKLTLNLGNCLPQGLNVEVIGGGFLSCRGDAFLQFDQAEGPITPGLHQIARQLCQCLIGGIRENTGVKAVATRSHGRDWCF